MAKHNVRMTKATQKLIDQLKGNLRWEDKRECEAVSGKDADKALQEGLEKSFLSWVGLYNEKPFCAFGVVKSPNYKYVGYVWLLGTNDMVKAKIGFLRICKEYVNEMLSCFSMLTNYVDARNKLSINWLRWLGFTVYNPEPYGLKGKLFHPFILTKLRGESNV